MQFAKEKNLVVNTYPAYLSMFYFDGIYNDFYGMSSSFDDKFKDTSYGRYPRESFWMLFAKGLFLANKGLKMYLEFQKSSFPVWRPALPLFS